MTPLEILKHRYQLQPHPEGGWYREIHRSSRQVQSDRGTRDALTVILFLLEAGAISRWHRVAGGDESWHWIGGDPLELLILPAAGGEPQRQRLGFALDDPMLQPVAVVPADAWQVARSLGAWSLVSCCVGPGFCFDDFTLLHQLPGAQHPGGALVDLL